MNGTRRAAPPTTSGSSAPRGWQPGSRVHADTSWTPRLFARWPRCSCSATRSSRHSSRRHPRPAAPPSPYRHNATPVSITRCQTSSTPLGSPLEPHPQHYHDDWQSVEKPREHRERRGGGLACGCGFASSCDKYICVSDSPDSRCLTPAILDSRREPGGGLPEPSEAVPRRRTRGAENQGKKSRKFNQGCTICSFCRSSHVWFRSDEIAGYRRQVAGLE